MQRSEAGSNLRLIDSCTTQFKFQGPSRTCNESKEEAEEEWEMPLASAATETDARDAQGLDSVPGSHREGELSPD